jgi:dTDP-4-dehydrorhamnose 3,5-epimerase
MIKINKTKIHGAYLLDLTTYKDSRGFFLETYQYQKYSICGIDCNFVQDNRSLTKKGILRGLHYQITNPIGHLVYVTKGRIFDVGLDLRINSPTFGHCLSTILSDEIHQQLYLPPGVAHGFCALDEINEVHYKCTEYYFPNDEAGVLWNDPDLGIKWPLLNPIISQRDSNYPRLCDIDLMRLPNLKI